MKTRDTLSMVSFEKSISSKLLLEKKWNEIPLDKKKIDLEKSYL